MNTKKHTSISPTTVRSHNRVARVLLAAVAVFFASTTMAQNIKTTNTRAQFDVEVMCESGRAHIAMIDERGSSVLDIGSVGVKGAKTEDTTQFLSRGARSAIAIELLTGEGVLENANTRGNEFEIAACLGSNEPVAANGTCVPWQHSCDCTTNEDGTGCEIFNTICTATGGDLHGNGTYICEW
ncbi:MAG: hypothetical protein K0U93_28725 [Gammaproteobacteria bacterium]|nr:hypothetical protein [Gammaproteobacteria bacterium]